MMSASGLRERKKLKTRSAIQEHALRLIEAHGYDETTIAQIAAAADISPSTFFRYFPTKEDVVIDNELSRRIVTSFLGEPRTSSTVTAFRHTVATVLGDLGSYEWAAVRSRLLLTMSTPALRMRGMAGLGGLVGLLSGRIAGRLGRSVDDFESRVVAGACLGVVLSVVLSWADSGGTSDLAIELDLALARLGGGFAI